MIGAKRALIMLKIEILNVALKILRKVQTSIYGEIIRSGRVLSKQDQVSRIVESTSYNMQEEANEKHYLDEYFYQIEKSLPKNRKSQSLSILDMGCGQGRFIERLLKLFPYAEIVGIDISEGAIDYAKSLFVKNKKVQLIVGNYSSYLDSFPDNSFDILVFTEVAFFFPGWKSDFAKMVCKLKSDGHLIFSTRSSYFNVLSQISAGNLMDALRISNTEDGNIAIADPMRFTWNSSKELTSFFQNNSMTVLSISGIGVCSGIEGDPLAKIAMPNALNADDRKILKNIENFFSNLIPDAGRYILVIARKP
jgi:2-polyprenyl-3-methyl-5-hydroxy-6-metoxy-1,4-benzoquinol methylase